MASEMLSRLQAMFSRKGAEGAAPRAPDAASPPGSLALGMRLLAQLREKNAVVSPAGIHAALRLAALGAAEGSAAAAELGALLGRGDGGYGAARRAKELTMATAVYAGAAVKPAYKKKAQKELGAEVAPLPASADPVNAWVAAATRGKITSLVSQVPPGTVALLCSAVHFAAPWAAAFDPEDTEAAPFASATTPQVRMMGVRSKRFAYAERPCGAATVQVASLPYGGGGGFAAVVVLPAPEASLDDVVRSLSGEGGAGAAEWAKLIGAMRNTELGYLALPRFKLEWGGSLREPIAAMGVQAAFAGGAFDDIAPGAAISDVVHKATIECTEKGTVASAATAVMMARSMPRPKPEFVCNRPFLFAITAGEELIFVCRVDDAINPQ